ncbi:hypothetical protein ACFWJM_11715 [Streptomyces sp. NPDC127077]|uniref:hypothetical protein n=1 Tax=Streptomyces sp. NPDC127077 TaxID=3347131 RepID=UPI003653BF39
MTERLGRQGSGWLLAGGRAEERSNTGVRLEGNVDDSCEQSAAGFIAEDDKTRFMPDISTVFHIAVYCSTENGSVILDARTGKDKVADGGNPPSAVNEYAGLFRPSQVDPAPSPSRSGIVAGTLLLRLQPTSRHPTNQGVGSDLVQDASLS